MSTPEIPAQARAILAKCKELGDGVAMIKPAGDDAALKEAMHDKAMAITLIKLKNGVEMVLDGNRIQNPPATTSEKIAKGICFQEKIDMEQAKVEYKRVLTKISATEKQLNANQSVNRYLDSVG